MTDRGDRDAEPGLLDDGHARVHAARRAESVATTPAEGFQLMNALCRQVTWMAANARVD